MSSVMDTRFITPGGRLLHNDDSSLDRLANLAKSRSALENSLAAALEHFEAEHGTDGNCIGSNPLQVPFGSQPLPVGLPDYGFMAVDPDMPAAGVPGSGFMAVDSDMPDSGFMAVDSDMPDSGFLAVGSGMPATGNDQVPQNETEAAVVLPTTQEGPQMPLADVSPSDLVAAGDPLTPPPELALLAPLVGLAPEQPDLGPRFIPPWDLPSEPQRHSEYWPQSPYDADLDPNCGLFGLPPSATADINTDGSFAPEVSEAPQKIQETTPGSDTALSSDSNILDTTSFQSAFQLPDPFWQPNAMTADGSSESQSVLRGVRRPIWRDGMDIPDKPQKPLPASQPVTLPQHGDMPPSSKMSSLPTPEGSGQVTPVSTGQMSTTSSQQTSISPTDGGASRRGQRIGRFSCALCRMNKKKCDWNDQLRSCSNCDKKGLYCERDGIDRRMRNNNQPQV